MFMLFPLKVMWAYCGGIVGTSRIGSLNAVEILIFGLAQEGLEISAMERK
jgi:hypothetical protein